jgi:hypothetical protein
VKNRSGILPVQQPADGKLLSQNDERKPERRAPSPIKWKVGLSLHCHHRRYGHPAVRQKSDIEPSHPPHLSGYYWLKLLKTALQEQQAEDLCTFNEENKHFYKEGYTAASGRLG